MFLSPGLLGIISSGAGQRSNLRNDIIRYKRDFAEYQAALKEVESQQPIVVEVESLSRIAVMGDKVVQFSHHLDRYTKLRDALTEQLDQGLPWVVTDMLRRGNTISIPRGQGEGSLLMWLSELGSEYIIEYAGYDQDPREVLDDSTRNKTVTEFLMERHNKDN